MYLYYRVICQQRYYQDCGTDDIITICYLCVPKSQRHCRHPKVSDPGDIPKKSLRICVILLAFFDPRNEEEIWNLFNISQF